MINVEEYLQHINSSLEENNLRIFHMTAHGTILMAKSDASYVNIQKTLDCLGGSWRYEKSEFYDVFTNENLLSDIRTFKLKKLLLSL